MRATCTPPTGLCSDPGRCNRAPSIARSPQVPSQGKATERGPIVTKIACVSMIEAKERGGGSGVLGPCQAALSDTGFRPTTNCCPGEASPRQSGGP
jgi:hypothetical protein